MTSLQQLWRRVFAQQKLRGRVGHQPGRGKSVAVAARWAQGRVQAQPSPAFSGEDSAVQALQWQRGLKAGWVGSLLLQAHEYRVELVDAPKVPREEQRAALRWQLKDLLDFAVEQAALDFVDMPGPTPGSRGERMFAMAAPHDVLARWVDDFRAQRCALDSVDVPEMALRNLVVLAVGDEAAALLHIGLGCTRLALVWQRELCSIRQFELSASQLHQASADDRQIQLDRLTLEVQRTVDAFSRQFHGASTPQLLLSCAAHGEQVLAYLADNTGLKARAYRLEEHLDWPADVPVQDVEQGIDYLLAAGAALRPLARATAQRGAVAGAPATAVA